MGKRRRLKRSVKPSLNHSSPSDGLHPPGDVHPSQFTAVSGVMSLASSMTMWTSSLLEMRTAGRLGWGHLGEEEGRQLAVLRGLSTLERSHKEGLLPAPSNRRCP